MPTTVESHDGIPGGDVRAAWERLVDADPAATVFHEPRYLEVWHRELGKAGAARVHVMRRGDDVIGIVAEGRTVDEDDATTTVRFLGGTEVTDYLGPVSRPEDRREVVAAYLDLLGDDRSWDRFVAAGLAADSGWVEPLHELAPRSGLAVADDELEDVCPRVSVADGYEAYLDALPGKLRQEQRRKARKLARDAGGVRLREAHGEDVDDALETFFELAGHAEPDKSRFLLDDDVRRFFHALADAYAGERVVRVHLLDVAGAPGAATISLVHGGMWGLYNSAFDQQLSMLSPGMVLVTQLIQEAGDEQLATFDLLRGDEPYKYRFGAEDRMLRRLTIARA